MYKSIIRPVLFKFNPEKAHNITFAALKLVSKLGGRALFSVLFNYKNKQLEKEVFV